MRRRGIIYALLVFVRLLVAAEAKDSTTPYNSDSGITSELTYEYATYSCEAEQATALLTVTASGTKAKRPVLSLTSVMDLSGSMAGADRITLMQDTNVFLLKELAELDNPHRFGTVTFQTGTNELVPLDVIKLSSVQSISDKIKATSPGGSTNLLGGLERGFLQQTQDTADSYCVRVVFVFTDGRPNGSPNAIVAKAKELVAKRPDVAIYTFGYGSNLDYNLLHRLAEVGRGTASIIKKPEDMATAFGAALAGLLSQMADSIKYTITPMNGAQIKSVQSGGKTNQNGDAFEIDLGDMQMGERRTTIINFLTGKSCSPVDPIGINGKNVDSSTGEMVDDEPTNPGFDRNQNPPKQEPDVIVVAEKLRRSVFDEKFKAAIDALNAGNEAGAIQALESLVQSLEATGLKKKVLWIRRGLEDVQMVLEQLKTTAVENAFYTYLIADLYSIWDAITKQRTGSTNQNLKSVEYIMTAAKEELSMKAKREVLDIIPPAPFTLLVSEAVSRTTKEEGYNIIDVLYALEAPPMKGNRPPLSLTLVIDTSQSMSGHTNKVIIRTLKYLLDWLNAKRNANILLGVFTFADTVQELLPLTKLSGIDIPKAKATFDAIQARGKAKIGAALTEGVNQQLSFARCSGSRVVFLLSNSASDASSDAIVKNLKAQLGSPKSLVSVYTFAMERGDAQQMEMIAAAGNGQRYILSSPDDIPSSFGDAIAGLIGVSAKDTKITFAPADPTVEIVSIFPKGEPQGQGSFNVSVPKMFESERREFLASVRFPESSSPSLILTISTSYVDADSCGVAESTVASIGTNEKLSASIKQRQLERDVAVKLKQGSKICMTTSNLEEVISLVREANYVAAMTKATSYRWALIMDLMKIRGTLRRARDGSVPREDACAQMAALIELFETERYKCMDSNSFLVAHYYDSETRRESRNAMVRGVISEKVYQKSNSAVSDLRSQINTWMRDAGLAYIYHSDTKTIAHRSGTSMQDVMVDVTSSDVFEEQNIMVEELAASLMQIDDAVARADITAALTEASMALRRMQESPLHDHEIIDAFINHLMERGKRLLESVDSGRNEGFGSDRNTPLAE